MKKINIYKNIFKIVIILIWLLLFIIFFGNKYLPRLDKFIIENNKIIIENEVSNFVLNLKNKDIKPLYKLNYNEKGEIISSSINTNSVNLYLSTFTSSLRKSINKKIYSFYINSYFKNITTKNQSYILFPMGMLSNNPFLYNFGPKIVLSYDYLTSVILSVDIKVKNYGINNVLVETYITINIKQSILKPTVENIINYKKKFLLSSDIIYGKVSDYLGYNNLSLTEKVKTP